MLAMEQGYCIPVSSFLSGSLVWGVEDYVANNVIILPRWEGSLMYVIMHWRVCV